MFSVAFARSIMIWEARNSSRRWTIVTLEANFVRNVASSSAESPPPTTATSRSRKKNPSHVAHAETPRPCSALMQSTHRTGPNNSRFADLGDPGSPYAIGSPAGGHDAIEPTLGTFDDVALALTRDGRFLMQIGRKGQNGGSNDVRNLGGAANMTGRGPYAGQLDLRA